VIFEIKHFRYCKNGHKFDLIANHKALDWLLKLKEMSAKGGLLGYLMYSTKLNTTPEYSM